MFKVTARDQGHKRPSGAFVTYSNISCCCFFFIIIHINRSNCQVMHIISGGGRVVRRYRINFQCRGVLLVWMIVGQGPIALAVGAGGGYLDIFSLIYHFSSLSPSLSGGRPDID